MLNFAKWLAGTEWSIALHESLYWYPWIESSHVLFICIFFGTLATIGIVSEFIRDYKNPPIDIRQQHIQQHFDEQVKYDEMIKILDSINHKFD